MDGMKPFRGLGIIQGIVLLVMLTLMGITFSDIAAQAPKPRLSCEEITGGLYIANAQLAEQLRDTAAKLAEAQAELAKTQPAK